MQAWPWLPWGAMPVWDTQPWALWRCRALPGQSLRATARRLLQQQVAQALGLPVQALPWGHGPDGRWGLLAPVGVEWSWSCSYCADEALLALARGPARIGIDWVEVGPWPDWEPVAHGYLGPQETQALLALPPQAQASAFALAWAKLEAGLKSQGQGLTEWSAQAALARQDRLWSVQAGLLVPKRDGVATQRALAVAFSGGDRGPRGRGRGRFLRRWLDALQAL